MLVTRPAISSNSVLIGRLLTHRSAVSYADVLDWDDRLALQNRWSLSEKGWEVEVEWKVREPYGVGLFVAENVEAGKILRRGKVGTNLWQFRTVREIEEFLGDPDETLYCHRQRYVSDYLWGFHPLTDDCGYEIPSETKDEEKVEDRFFGMWIPGNGLNHNVDPNTVYRSNLPVGIDLVALRDLNKGEELYDDYRRHGRSPKWLRDWAESQGTTLNFSDCNNFVGD